jgi:hypothetical protein
VIEGPLVDAPDRLARLARVAIDEVFDQQRDVVGALAKRWHRDRKHVQPIEEIAAERAGLDRRLQVAVRGGDDAHVDAHRCAPSDALELALLQDTEQCDLRLHRQLADFVEEEGPPCASSKRPRRRWVAPVNAPFSWPKSSDAMSSRGIAAQLTLTKAPDARADRRWIARATSSLPVPVSPVISTVESLRATFATRASTGCSAC